MSFDIYLIERSFVFLVHFGVSITEKQVQKMRKEYSVFHVCGMKDEEQEARKNLNLFNSKERRKLGN